MKEYKPYFKLEEKGDDFGSWLDNWMNDMKDTLKAKADDKKKIDDAEGKILDMKQQVVDIDKKNKELDDLIKSAEEKIKDAQAGKEVELDKEKESFVRYRSKFIEAMDEESAKELNDLKIKLKNLRAKEKIEPNEKERLVRKEIDFEKQHDEIWEKYKKAVADAHGDKNKSLKAKQVRSLALKKLNDKLESSITNYDNGTKAEIEKVKAEIKKYTGNDSEVEDAKVDSDQEQANMSQKTLKGIEDHIKANKQRRDDNRDKKMQILKKIDDAEKLIDELKKKKYKKKDKKRGISRKK